MWYEGGQFDVRLWCPVLIQNSLITISVNNRNSASKLVRSGPARYPPTLTQAARASRGDKTISEYPPLLLTIAQVGLIYLYVCYGF